MRERTCTIEECGRPHEANGWCASHLRRWQKKGDPLAGGPLPPYNPTSCSVEHCVDAARKRGLCASHYRRNERHGDVTAETKVRRFESLEDRFWSKVDATGPCWEWAYSLNSHGYGQFNIDNIPKLAHRLSWELLVGLVPSGLVLDHLCRNRACVNPDHLEPVTQTENIRRAPWTGQAGWFPRRVVPNAAQSEQRRPY